MQLRLSAICAILVVPSLMAAELQLLPTETSLTGPRAQQQLSVVDSSSGKAIADLTSSAKFVSSNPRVAVVDGTGLVRPVGDGETTIVASVDGRTARSKVVIVKFADPAPPSFINDVQPILTRSGCNSGACHGALAGKGGLKLSLRGYDPESDHFALTRQSLARRTDRSEPEKSLFLLKGARIMPHGGGTRIERDSASFRALVDWARGGANGPTADEATVKAIEVLPRHAVLKPKDKVRLIVLARYSDGRTQDVTRLSKFVSSEAQAADVDEDGQVTVAGHGEAAVSAIYENRVASMVVTSPFPNSVPASAYPTVPPGQFIDQHVNAKLRELNLPPSAACTDAEFIRRAYLDAAGILPTPAEVGKFVGDRSANKREMLIESITQRPEFVDYWAYKWCDLMLVSTRKLPQPAMWAFYRSIRQSVADNARWDRIAREMLTVSGSTLDRGAGNFFVLHKDTADLTESAAVTFMGMSITCARCHNHPLEKWTQDQYWAMANLFSRVDLKNGERAGDIVVRSSIEGDVLHPRRNVAMPPAPLDGKPMANDDSADRRAYFANWLTSPDNPYFAKALVNRVWKNFMGRGLVEAEDDLRETNPATNPELFDALSKNFVANGFDVRRLIRQIMSSAAYQRSSRPVKGNEADDRHYSRYLIRRLSGEVIVDALSQVTGVPTAFTQVYTGVEGGTAATANYPEGTRALQLPDSRVASKFLDAFGRPDRVQTCSCERQQDSTVGQALMLNNGNALNDKLRSPRSQASALVAAKASNEEVVRRVFELALCRSPNTSELTRMSRVLTDAGSTPEARREAIEDVFWAVLTSREFLFNH